MPQGKCQNCGRLIYDTEKVEELQDEMECQHCHHINIIRVKPATEPAPVPIVSVTKKGRSQ